MNLFHPSSIAIIGASDKAGKIGYVITNNLRTQGYKGDIYPINHKDDTVQGLPAYASVLDTPSIPELVVIAIPGAYVPAVLEECGQKGCKDIIVISAGFGEVHTEDGNKLEAELQAVSKKYNLNIIGPNCLGVLAPPSGMNASFYSAMPPSGDIALISQSGAITVALMDSCQGEHALQPLGFSFVASIGNKTILDECDYLEMCRDDEHTKVIGFYLESITDGTRFLKLCREINPIKPIVLLKSGVSSAGAKAASSHTGALAGNDAAIEALVKQAGITRAHTLSELIDILAVKHTQPALPSNNVAVITNAGGAGILATDAAEQCNLKLPKLLDKSNELLTAQLPPAASLHNPIDILGDATPDKYKLAIEACLQDSNIDGICVLLTPQAQTNAKEVAIILGELSAKEPLTPIVASFMGAANIADAQEVLTGSNVPHFDSPKRAMQALASLRQHKLETFEHLDGVPPSTLKEHGLLTPELTTTMLHNYQLPHPTQLVVTSAGDALKHAQEVGYPLIAKVDSPELAHKTDVGGVVANIESDEQLGAAYTDIIANVKRNAPHATINGMLLQPMLPAGNEFIIGGIRDASFGPMVMVGLGGIYAELFKDTSFRIAPITKEAAYNMLSELTSWKLLLGMRGKPQQDIDALADAIVSVGSMMNNHPEIESIDLNPVLVRDKEVMVVDAKITTS